MIKSDLKIKNYNNKRQCQYNQCSQKQTLQSKYQLKQLPKKVINKNYSKISVTIQEFLNDFNYENRMSIECRVCDSPTWIYLGTP